MKIYSLSRRTSKAPRMAEWGTMERKRAAWPYAAGAIGIGLTLAAAWWLLGVKHFTPQEAASWLHTLRNYWWMPLAYAGLYALFSVVMIPPTPLSVAGALIWGWWLGGLIELFVFTASSFIAFALSHSTVGRWLEPRLPERAKAMQERIHQRGFFILFLLRMIPIIPSPLLNYSAGLARIKPRDYLAATFLGSIPSVFIFTYLVDSVAAATVSVPNASVRVIIAGVLIASFALIGRRLARMLRG